MTCLWSSGLNSGQSFVVSRNRIVVLQAFLGTPLFVNVEQRNRRRVVLHQPHLRRNCDDARHREVQESSRSFFVFSKQMIHHSKQLKDSLFPTSVGQAWIAYDEVRIDFSVVASNVESSRGGVVLLNDFHFRHEPLDADLVMRVLRKEQLPG